MQTFPLKAGRFFFSLRVVHCLLENMDKSDLADLRCITEVLRGDVDAFRDVVQRYHAYIYRVALFHLRSPDDAEDAAQEIFLRAFKALNSFRVGRRFKPWLVGIALNHLRTAWGRKQRERNLEAKIRRQPVAEPEDPVELVLKEDARESVRKAILGLPRTLKDPALLYYVHDMGVGEISETLRLERENVKSRLHRARSRLRRILETGATGSSDPRYNKRERGHELH